jgi:N-ATPase, AtpR subunit
MNWAAAAGTGFGLGLAYFGGLWLGIRGLKSGTLSVARFALGRTARLAVAAVLFYALLNSGGASAVLAGLAGLIAARWYLIRAIGEPANGG